MIYFSVGKSTQQVTMKNEGVQWIWACPCQTQKWEEHFTYSINCSKFTCTIQPPVMGLTEEKNIERRKMELTDLVTNNLHKRQVRDKNLEF